MVTWDWDKLCGTSNGTFIIWNNDDFGHCFEELVFVCSAHVLLAITSAYHLSRHQYRRLRGLIPHQPTLYFRLAIAILLLLCPLLTIALVYLYEELHPSLIDILSWSIQAASWLLHSSYVWRLRRLFHVHIRGHTIVVLSYFLAAATDIIKLRTVIIQLQHSKSIVTTVEEVFTFIRCGLHLFYLISLIPYQRPDVSSGLASSSSTHVQHTGETTGLLASSSGVHTYGSIPRETLGVAEEKASCLSKLTFWWVQPLLVKGAKGLLHTTTDLFTLPRKLNTYRIDEKVHQILTPEGCADLSERTSDLDDNIDYAPSSDENSLPSVAVVTPRSAKRHSKPKDKQTLLSCLNKAFGCQYYLLGILKFFSDGLSFAGPLLLNLLVTYMENPGEPEWHGYVYAAALFGTTLIGSLLSTHFNYHISVVQLKMRAAIITTLYRKSLAVSSVTLSKFTTGEVINFMSSDTDRIINFCPSFHQFWSLPIQVGVALYLLYQQVGLAFLAGLGFSILLIPINRWIAIKIGILSTSMMQQKDGRVKVMNEILSGIRVIKFYAWEKNFAQRILGLRESELNSLKGRKYLDALCVYFWATTPVLISILTFMTYALMGNELTAAKVFTSMALFMILIMPLNAFPWVINGLIEAWVSLKRIENFLKLQEFQKKHYYSKWKRSRREYEVQIQGGYFTWNPPKEQPGGDLDLSQSYEGFTDLHHSGMAPSISDDSEYESRTQDLQNIHLSIPKGKLTGVVGTVGCGKSSLLSCLLGEMHCKRGHISVQNLSQGFGLASQEPWLQHATIQDNILFGRELVPKRYNQVLEACALVEDLRVLPGGDQTEIGERGVTLSGGQKARVALARAVYQDKDLYLLDDPLSAVDAHVAQHLFEKCIMGLLRNKTRILATHHTQFLRHADLVVVMEEGCIAQCGPPSELNDVDFDATAKRRAYPRQRHSMSEDRMDGEEDFDSDEEEEEEEEGRGPPQEEPDHGANLMEEEERAEGVVKLAVYSAYWKAVGACLSPMVLLALFLMQVSRNLSDWWLSFWVTHSQGTHIHNGTTTITHPHLIHCSPLIDPGVVLHRALHHEIKQSDIYQSNITLAEDNIRFYLMIYGCLAGANSLFTLIRAFLFAYGGVCAATVVHKDLLRSILKAPIGFFDVTPLGRIMNRFSTDVYCVDDSLPFLLNILLAQAYGLLGTIVICCYGLPWIILLLIPLSLLYYFIQRYYRQTSRDLKRIASVSLSPVYAHFSETVAGLSTIRALRETERFERENKEKLEENQRAQFASNAVAQWLGIRLQMIGVAMVTGVAFIGVLEHHFDTVNPGLVGLAISYALAVTGQLNGVVTMFTETEKQMVSMERADHYINCIPREKHWHVLNAPPYWPIQGSVNFQQVCLQYRPGLPLALNCVTFETKPAEKVGIVGRTGSGKSSLFLALFRMIEIQSGSICVDGINVGHLPLDELRSRFAIIPQDPFLFSGTVRDNLDPTHSCSDDEIWSALDKCHLRQAVIRLGGLDSEIAERGRHFSVGQRQLLCLTRAMIARAKVICIDEATASVDQTTDRILQETIRAEFQDHTVLTIAHRVRTILDSDRVLVMSEGRAVEYEPPSHLLLNPKSLFYSLVHGEREG